MPWWQSVRTLGLYSLAHHRAHLTPAIDTALVVARLRALANSLLSSYQSSGYRVVIGHSSSDFVWGSNAVAANQAMALLVAHQLTGDANYLDAACANLDYLLGRNATGYSFVTGFGDQTPFHPHHRPSQSDNVVQPVPGLLVGSQIPGSRTGFSIPRMSPHARISTTSKATLPTRSASTGTPRSRMSLAWSKPNGIRRGR